MASNVPVSTSGQSSATSPPSTSFTSSFICPSTHFSPSPRHVHSPHPLVILPPPPWTDHPPTTSDADYGFVITLIHRNVSRMVLYRVLHKGTSHKDPGVDMITYLKNLPSTSTANYVKQGKHLKLNKKQMKMVKQCNSGEMFDVTLQALFIKYACEGLKGVNDPSWCTYGLEYLCKECYNINDHYWCTHGLELETYISIIENQSWDFRHKTKLPITQATFQDKEKDLCQLLINTAHALQQRYEDSMTIKERDDLIKEIEEKLDRIRDGELPQLRRECQEELKTKLQLLKHFNPMSFINGSSLALDVIQAFTDTEIVHRQHQVARVVSYQSFLAEIHEDKKHEVVLLEGMAEAGKTILMTLVLQEWFAGYGIIRELDGYDVVLHVVCQDSSTDSYISLVKESFPKTFTHFRESTLPILAQCCILVLIDGLDEANQASKKLVKDVLQQLNGVNATIICATRPERSLAFQNIAGSSISCINAKIKGIPENKRLMFMEKNHRILKQLNNSGRDTDQLLQLMKEKIKLEHIRLPLNLMLAVCVFDQDPEALGGITTQTELYYHAHQLSKMKVQQRLSNCPNMCTANQASIINLINEWEKVMFNELLLALSMDQLVLSSEAVMRLQREAQTQGLPADEVLRAFLTLKCIGIELQKYSAPHKGIQDFCAALYIVENLKENQSSSRPKIMSIIENAIGINKADVKKYQNVLQHTAGILHLCMDEVPNDLDYEVVTLLGDAGVWDIEQWLDLVDVTKSSPAVLAAIAKIAFPDEDNYVEVTDGRVNTWSALLPLINTSRVKINIDCVSLNLDPLVDSLDHHEYTLTLHGSWIRRSPDFNSHPSIPKLLSSDGIVEFSGQWTAGMEIMSSSLQILWLSIADETKASQLVTELVPLLHLLPNLKKLSLRVPLSVSPEGLNPLPTLPWTEDGTGVDLYLSDVKSGGARRASEVANKLKPKGGSDKLVPLRTTHMGVAMVVFSVPALPHVRFHSVLPPDMWSASHI